MAERDLTTYIALFHHRDNAAAAIRDLEASGFTRNALTLIGGGNGTSYSDSKGIYGQGFGYGSHESLADIGVPEDDRKHLEDALAHGGTVLALEGAGSRAIDIEKVFHRHSATKIDEMDINNAPSVAPLAAATLPAMDTESTVIPVTQEELVVGKREVERGGVRVFRRIVEEPVSESVSLREEHVVIDRRPVDRAVTEADLRGGDRTIELTETAEEAVVGKTAHVVEEIRLGKEATEHTETIRDTVRHTEVDVEQVESLDTTNRSKGY